MVLQVNTHTHTHKQPTAVDIAAVETITATSPPPATTTQHTGIPRPRTAIGNGEAEVFVGIGSSSLVGGSDVDSVDKNVLDGSSSSGTLGVCEFCRRWFITLSVEFETFAELTGPQAMRYKKVHHFNS